MASVGHTRVIIAIVLVCSFAISYSGALLYAIYVRFADIMMLNAWRDLSVTLFIFGLAFLALTYKSQMEREIVILGFFYFVSIYLWRTLNHLGYLLAGTQWWLMIINGFTFAYLLIILINAERYDLLKDNE